MERKEIIRKLVEEGATMTKNVTVKNVTVKECEDYTRLGISLDNKVKGYRKQEDASFAEEDVNIIFISAFSIISLLKDIPTAAFAANKLLSNPESLSVILCGSKIDIIAEPVVSGQEYKNPWSETAEPTVFDHDTIIHHVVNVEISQFGQDMLKQLALNMMGIK